MRKSISFIVAATILLLWFGASINMLIRYNLNWIDYMRYSADLTPEQKDYFSKEHITCGVRYNDLPLSFVNENQQNDGIFIDFINQLSVELENDMDIRLDQEENLARDFETGEIQAAIVDKSQMPEGEYLFTEPLYIMHGKMLVRENSELEHINQLRDVRIAVERGEEGVAERIIELYGSKGVSVVYAADFQESLAMLDSNQVAAVAGDETKLSYLINQQRSNRYYKFLRYSFSRREICVALHACNASLLDAFNKAVLSMKKKNLITKTQSKWFGAMEPEIVDMTEVDLIYHVGFFFLLCGAVFTLWNLSTAKKVTEKTRELFNSKEQLRLIIDTLNQGLVIAGQDGTILEVNDEICRIIGVGKHELLHTSIHCNDAILPYLQHDDEKVYKWNGHYYTKNTIDLGGKEKRLYIIADCTQRYMNEIRNIQEEKLIAVGQLSAGLAHEIRNPLGLIKSYMFLIKDLAAGEEEGAHALCVIDDSIKRINNLIESLLKFSRLSGEEYKKIDVEELIKNILFLEKKQLEKDKIEASLQMTGETPLVLINGELLKITIINLLNNSIDALQYTEGQRNIDISVHIGAKALNMVFKDNGCGIDSRRLLEIFNPFYTSKERGTGLGLYIVHSQIEQAGGSIRAESAPNEGTVFYVEIPVKTERTEHENGI